MHFQQSNLLDTHQRTAYNPVIYGKCSSRRPDVHPQQHSRGGQRREQKNQRNGLRLQRLIGRHDGWLLEVLQDLVRATYSAQRQRLHIRRIRLLERCRHFSHPCPSHGYQGSTVAVGLLGHVDGVSGCLTRDTMAWLIGGDIEFGIYSIN